MTLLAWVGTAARRSALAAAVALVLLVSTVSPVSADVSLTSSDPAAESAVSGTPPSIALRFNEDLRADRSQFTLRAVDGTIIGRGGPDAADPRLLVFVPPALEPGTYRIEWQAVGTDGHLIRDTFSFSVAPTPTAAPTVVPSAAPSAAPSVAPSATATPATPAATPAPVDEAPVASSSDVLIPILAGLALIGGLGVFLLRRSRAR